MVDTIDLNLMNDLSDVVNAIDLVNIAMGGQKEAFLARALEDGGEFRRRIVPLVGIQAHADDRVLEREGLHQRRHGILGRLVSQETHDQAGGDAQRALRRQEADAIPSHHCREGDAPGGVRLRVEEQFDVLDVLRMGVGEIGQREIAEVVLRPQDRHVWVVDGQKAGEVVE